MHRYFLRISATLILSLATGATSAVPSDDAMALSKALQFRTVSYDDAARRDYEPFLAFHDFLRKQFPLAHQKLDHRTIANYSLLYHWTGLDQEKLPILLTAHMDVVPVETATRDAWKYAPFSGTINAGRIYGRGAFDNKIQLISILSTIERLLAAGFVPSRDIFLAFGHDEELGGGDGAMMIAAELAESVGRFAFVLDEGGAVIEASVFSDMQGFAALVGVGEKGEVNLTLSAQAGEGLSHSSSPAENTPIVRLAKAITRLTQHPLEARVTGPIDHLLDALGQQMSGLQGFALRNRWLLNGAVKQSLASKPASNAMIRTTMVPTMITGSPKANSIPDMARANLNVRILPGDSIESVIKHVTQVIDDPLIEITIKSHLNPRNPRIIKDLEGGLFSRFTALVGQQFSEARFVSPWLITGGTDARHYQQLSDNVFGFTPITMTQEQLNGPHGINEWVAITNLEEAAGFYRELFLQLEKIACAGTN